MPVLSRRTQLALAFFNLFVACTDFGELNPPPVPRTWGGGGAFNSSASGSGGTSYGGRSVGGAATRTTAQGAAGQAGTGASAGDATAGRAATGRGGAGGTAGGGTTTGGGTTGGGTTGGGGRADRGAGAGAESGAGSGGVGGEGSAAGSWGTGAVIGPFISEYVEGSSAGGNIKALEIAVQTAGSLAGCKLNVYANGLEKLSRTIALTETVMRDAPLVICSPELSLPACQRSESLPFNGNDAILLYCDDALLDAFGRLGEDPGEAGWPSETFATTDITLRRSCAVTGGDANATDAFAPAAQWLSAGKDATDGLGTHCAPPAAGAGAGAGGTNAGAAGSAQ